MPKCRPLPPIPDLDISEDLVLVAADEMRVWINRALAMLREIAVDGNLRTLIMVLLILFSLLLLLDLCF